MATKIINGNFPVNVNFNLRATTPANKDTAVNAVVRFDNQRVVISGITKAQPRYWKDGKPTQHAGNANAPEIRKAIRQAEATILEVFNGYTNQHRSFPHDLKAFQALLRRRVFNIPDAVEQRPTDDKSLISYAERFRAEMQKGKRTLVGDKRGGEPYAKETHKSYGNIIQKLKGYRDHYRLDDIRFDDINIDFYDKFKAWILNQDHSLGYFGTLIKCLKSLMEAARHEGYHTNEGHKHRYFIKPQPESKNTVYLDPARLDVLAGLDLSQRPYLDKARDLFLIGAYTGLRFSDFTSITPENIQGDYIKIKTRKTGERVTIPITADLRAILDKHNGGTPGAISNQKLNEYLKELGEVAGFDNLVGRSEYRKGKEVTTQVPFHTLMTTHTARRSFASNMFEAGVPPLLIMAITGHQTERAFLTYIRQNNDDKAKILKTILDKIEAERKREQLKVVGGGE